MSSSEFVIENGLNVISGSVKVPAPVNAADAVNKGYVDANIATNIVPPRTTNNTVLTTDLISSNQMKWKGINIHDKLIDPVKPRYMKLTKISSQAVFSSVTDISFGTENNVDRSHFEVSYNKTYYIIKEIGTYIFFGQMVGITDSYVSNTTVKWSVYSDYTLTGTSFSPELGVDIYTSHSNKTTGEDNSMFGFTWIVPEGGVLFKIVARIVSGTSTINTSRGCAIQLFKVPENKYIDTWTDTWTNLNISTYTDIVMTDEYIHDDIYTFTAPSSTFRVTTTGNYSISAKISFQRSASTGTDTSGWFRLVDQTGSVIPGTYTGTQYLDYGSGEFQNVITMTWNGIVSLTATTSSVKMQAKINDGTSNVRAKGGFLMMKVSSSLFTNQTNFSAISTATPVLTSTPYNIPWQTTTVNSGGTSFTPGNTDISFAKNGLHIISANISIDNPLKINNKMISTEFQVSYDTGITWNSVLGTTIKRLTGFNTSTPLVLALNSFIGTLIRVVIFSSSVSGDLITLENNCNISIEAFENVTIPADLFSTFGTFHKYIESVEYFVIPITIFTPISSVATSFLPAGTYRVQVAGYTNTASVNTSATIKLIQSSINKKSLEIYNQTLFYAAKGAHSLSIVNNVLFDQGITRMIFSMSSDTPASLSTGKLIIEIFRVY